MDDWAAWSKLGLILKKLGAPYSLWQTMSARSKEFDNQQCEDWWKKAKIHNYTINSLRTLAKEGNIDEYARINPLLNSTKNVFDDGSNYPCIKINTPFLTTKNPEDQPTHPVQARFQSVAPEFVQNNGKSLVFRIRYGSGKANFSQRLIKDKGYRQS